jgi:two-component system phosphate regulon sensor histidine kinase PhoR
VRGPELFDFRKVVLLIVFTVCVPAAALSTFGILAIANERAAVEKKLEEAYAPRLERLAERLQAAPEPGGQDVNTVARGIFPAEPARYSVEQGEGSSVNDLITSLQGGQELGPPVARRPLGGALAGRSLVARLPAAESPASIALTNRVLYVVLLVLFYGILVVGVVLTLRTAWREAQLSRLKSDFVSHVSHELRTPLTSIRMFVETLRLGRARDEDERAECLLHLENEAERLSGLVDRLLDWARMESGRKIYRKIPERPETLVREAMEVFERQRGGRAEGVTVDVAGDLPEIEVDRDAMELVLVNLLTNAWKYTGAEKQIRVRAHTTGRRVALEVEDNGPGIPKSERKRIFEQFYRVDDLLTRRTEGTGLGLAICKRIVEDHGGRIEVSGDEGRGSRFTVLLPERSAA